MRGHVFIVRGDLRKLACDAWLLPCSRNARPMENWFLDDYEGPRVGEHFENDERVQPLGPPYSDRPHPWLCCVGSYGR